MPPKITPNIACGPEYAAIRASLAETREESLDRQNQFLGAHLAGQEIRLRRALRAQRRAAASGEHYDPARHLALARLCKRDGLRASLSRPTSGAKNSTGS